MVRRFFIKYAEQQLWLAGFKTDGKDWGLDKHYKFLSSIKKMGMYGFLKIMNRI